MAEITFTPTTVYYTLLCVVGVTVLLNLKRFFTRHDAGLRLPPGPRPLPVIGNMHCLLGALPHHAMRRLAQRYGPVMLLRLGQVRAVVISSPEAAREVMKTHDAVFANRPMYATMEIFTYGGRDAGFSPYGSKHGKELRRLFATELLGPKRVLSFRHIREEEAARLVSAIAAAAPPVVNVTERIKAVMADIIMRCAIGDTCPMRDEYIRQLDAAMRLMAGFNLIDLFPGSRLARMLGAGSLRSAREVHGRIHRVVQAVIQDHESKQQGGNDGASHGGDILDVLLRLQRDGGPETALTTEVVCAAIFDVFTGGSETTATTSLWVMAELARNPRMMERAQSEVRQVLQGKSKVAEADIQGRLPYLQMVIKETLRLHPPGPLLVPRQCAELTNIIGYNVPQGTTVFVNVWAIGRDERLWQGAEEFRPERFQEEDEVDFTGSDFRFLPGGAGRRMCPGLTFGLANIQMVLASLLYHFNWKLPNPHEELDMTEAYGISARRKADLLLEATPFVHH